MPTSPYCNNKSALLVAHDHNSVIHKRKKHIENDCYFIHEYYQQGIISFSHFQNPV